MIKELCCHDGADKMLGLSWSAGAAAVPIEAREGIGAAGLELAAEDVAFRHSSSVSHRRLR